MKLLAIETSTEACSAALNLNGFLSERYEIAPQQHNRLILPMIESLLSEAGLRLQDLDGLAFGRGPGSFTGVRIAAGVVQGLAFGADLPVAPVSTLAAMAQEALSEGTESVAFPCIDARMGEVYWGVYRRSANGWAELVGDEAVTPAEAVIFPEEALGLGIGSGWGTYEETLRQRLQFRVTDILTGRFPRAAYIAQLGVEVFRSGGAVSAENAQPVYLRDKVAKKKGGVY